MQCGQKWPTIRWSLMFAKNNDWMIWISYINTHINTYADLLSRFALNKFKLFANEQKMELQNELKALYIKFKNYKF